MFSGCGLVGREDGVDPDFMIAKEVAAAVHTGNCSVDGRNYQQDGRDSKLFGSGHMEDEKCKISSSQLDP
jgi:hypothetical protein